MKNKRDESIKVDPEIQPELVEAGLKAIEPFAFTSMDGYDMPKALAAAFKAMTKKSEELQSANR